MEVMGEASPEWAPFQLLGAGEKEVTGAVVCLGERYISEDATAGKHHHQQPSCVARTVSDF